MMMIHIVRRVIISILIQTVNKIPVKIPLENVVRILELKLQ